MKLEKGRVYRAKRPTRVGFYGYVNDRVILYIDTVFGIVQYDSPSVICGRKYPKVTIDAFLKWASHDVTDELPADEWAKS